MSNDISGILWRRLKYQLTPQLDVYKNLAPLVRGKSVLEVGFGTGFGTVQLASEAKYVVATELDPSAVLFAKEVFPLQNIEWRTDDITRDSLTNQIRYEAIVCLEVLEHVPDWQAALSAMARSLSTNGGTMYISGPNANASLRKNDKHEREWTAAEFREGLSKYFANVKLYEYTLTEEQGDDTNITPLLAVCKHG